MIEPPSKINPSQLEFLHATDPLVLMCGGVGSGKSFALQLKILQLKGLNGKLPGLIMAETMGELMSNVIDPLLEMLEATLPIDLQPEIVFDQKGRRYLGWPDGCKCHLRSAKSMEGFAGLNVAWLCGDEPWLWAHKSYLKAIERVRIKSAPLSQKAFASTPAMNWLADEFNTGKELRSVIHCGTRENAHNLAPGYIDGLLQSYSARMARAMIDGEWTVLEGAVYEAFDPSPSSPWIEHYDPAEHEYRHTYLAVDPGHRRSAWLWIHEVSDTEWIVFDEMMLDNTSDEAAVQRAIDRGWPIDEVWCDPAADQVQSAMSLDTLDMLAQIPLRASQRGGIRYITGPYRRIPYGVDKIRTLLGDPDRGQPIRIRFARRLLDIEDHNERGIVKDLSRYRYPEAKDDRPVTDIPLKDGKTDHACDALRYWGVGMWLTSPLRSLDPKLRERASMGYRAV